MFHVEHRLLLAILLTTLIGCKAENPNPELMDPIYSDLKKEAEGAAKALEAQIKEKEASKLAIQKADPNSIELREAEKLYWQATKKIDLLRPIEHYYKIHAERRRVEGRADYRRSLAKGEIWPDPKEYEGYMTNKRLRSAERNWNRRVPKLSERMPANQSKPKLEASSEE